MMTGCYYQQFVLNYSTPYQALSYTNLFVLLVCWDRCFAYFSLQESVFLLMIDIVM